VIDETIYLKKDKERDVDDSLDEVWCVLKEEHSSQHRRLVLVVVVIVCVTVAVVVVVIVPVENIQTLKKSKKEMWSTVCPRSGVCLKKNIRVSLASMMSGCFSDIRTRCSLSCLESRPRQNARDDLLCHGGPVCD